MRQREKFKAWPAVHQHSQFLTVNGTFPKEDRTFLNNRLFVDLVPSSCWFTNVRKCTDTEQWDSLRDLVYERAGNRCECCAREPGTCKSWRREGEPLRLEAHERWGYDQEQGIQTLKRLMAMCDECHAVTHFGHTVSHYPLRKEATNHLMQMSGWSEQQVSAHIKGAFARCAERSLQSWQLDLSMITTAGVRLRAEFSAKHRVDVAAYHCNRQNTAGMGSMNSHGPNRKYATPGVG